MISQNQPAVRINKALMSSYINSPAVIVGWVTRADPESRRVTLKTTDDEFIQIVFQKRWNFELQSMQLIEVYGTVTGANQFQGIKFAHFPPEASEKFSAKHYEKFLKYYISHMNRLSGGAAAATEQEPVLAQLNNDWEFDWNDVPKSEGPGNVLDETMEAYD